MSVMSVCGWSCEDMGFISGIFIHLVISGVLPVILGNIRGLRGSLTQLGRGSLGKLQRVLGF